MTKKYYSNFLREETKTIFADAFKAIIFNKHLSYGCRLFLLSLATVPVKSKYTNRQLGDKLGVVGHQIARWRSEAKRNKVTIGFAHLTKST
jgi:hypothetical protein